MIQYQAKILKEKKVYSVVFPDLPGCCSMGGSLEEAKEMASEALSLYLEEARDSNWKLPKAKNRKNRNYYWIQPHFNVSIALLIRQARIRNGLTQAELARKMSMTTQQFQKLETPGKSNPTVKTLMTLSKALNEDLKIQLVA